MADVPKVQQQYFNKIKQALGAGDEEMYTDLVRQKNPLAIREDLANVLGQHINENYESPYNVFEKKKILENLPVEYTNLPKGVAGRYELDDKKIYVPKSDSQFANKQTGVLVHELGHANDELKGFTDIEEFNPKLIKNLGAEAADSAFAKHHAGGFFEKEALMNLLKNKKLEMALPLLKAAGIGAIGASAIGIGNKAMAGDIKGATGDTVDLATDLTPIVGEAKMALSPSELGSSDLPPEEMIKRERFNKLRQRLLSK